jgi:DNA topoisomerase-1
MIYWYSIFIISLTFQFTAEMEDDLDEIARGKKQWQSGYWQIFGNRLKTILDKKEKEISKQALTEEKTDEVCEKCGSADDYKNRTIR